MCAGRTKLLTNEYQTDVVDLKPDGVNLTCKGESDPSTPVSFMWHFDEKGRANENNIKTYEIYNEPGQSTLHIYNDKFSGVCKCVITNGYSSDVKVFQVNSFSCESFE